MAAEIYCEPSDIKDAMPDTEWGEKYDALLSNLATRASRLIDNETGRRPGAFKLIADETLFFSGDNTNEFWVELAQAPTQVFVAEEGDLAHYTLWATSEYVLWPYNAILMGEPYRRIDINIWGNKLYWPSWPQCIKLIGRNGYSITPPADIIEATVIQSSRWYKRGQQAFQDTGAIAELGKLTYTKELDPDVKEILSHYTRISL